MNQGKIWLVVKPTVGLPAFLGGVAIISLCVHNAVLTHTDWYPAFYSGKAKKVAEVSVPNKPTVLAAVTLPADETAAPTAKAPPGKN
jgi:light-harvesting protein B-800-850 alpha chain